MISAGNDIVSLECTDAQRSKQERFYSKILSSAESELYRRKNFTEIPFETFVWLVWSVKESVYKYQKRIHPELSFSPRKVIIQNIDLPADPSVSAFGRGQYEKGSSEKEEYYTCMVRSGQCIFYSRSKIYNELIHTHVNNEKTFENIWWGIKYINEPDDINQSKSVRSFVLNKFSSIFANEAFFANEALEIGTSPIGYPFLLKAAKEMKIPISFTHHGHFIGYSFSLPLIQSVHSINRFFKKAIAPIYQPMLQIHPEKCIHAH